MKHEERIFCEDNAINIAKFLRENFILDGYAEKRSKKKLFKHENIAKWPEIIEVPINFACHNQELVKDGTIVIVKDEFGQYKAYIAPFLLQTVKRIEKALREGMDIEDLSNILHISIDNLAKKVRIVNCFAANTDVHYSREILQERVENNFNRTRNIN